MVYLETVAVVVSPLSIYFPGFSALASNTWAAFDPCGQNAWMPCSVHQLSPKLDLTVWFILWDGAGRAEEGCQPELVQALHAALLVQLPPAKRVFQGIRAPPTPRG